jgi:hypothetical protein
MLPMFRVNTAIGMKRPAKRPARLVGSSHPVAMTNAELYRPETPTIDGDPLSCRVARLVGKAAGRLNRTANYVGERDPEELVEDVRGFVRRNPGPSLAVAAALGLAIGWMRRK